MLTLSAEVTSREQNLCFASHCTSELVIILNMNVISIKSRIKQHGYSCFRDFRCVMSLVNWVIQYRVMVQIPLFSNRPEPMKYSSKRVCTLIRSETERFRQSEIDRSASLSTRLIQTNPIHCLLLSINCRHLRVWPARLQSKTETPHVTAEFFYLEFERVTEFLIVCTNSS